MPSVSTPAFHWSVIAAVNNEQILNSCLLSSPDVASAEVLIQTGHASAAQAYNAAIDKATSDILVFAHQDVFLPPGWLSQFKVSLTWLAQHDPNWAVAGAWGVKSDGSRAGNVYCTGLGSVLGRSGEAPVPVRTLDELLLVVRKSSGVRFDDQLPGFHFYGTDICLAAERKGLKCYALSILCVHNTNGYGMLPWQFWKIYWRMRRKWRTALPVVTPCIEIAPFGAPMFKWNLV